MRERRKAIAMDLIRWIFLFFDSLRIRQPVTENPRVQMDAGLAAVQIVRVTGHRTRRWSRGPTSLLRRSDL